MENKKQHNSSRTRTPLIIESYSKEEKNIKERATLAIKGGGRINQRHTKTSKETVHMESKEATTYCVFSSLKKESLRPATPLMRGVLIGLGLC